jgi:hypothetical protein
MICQKKLKVAYAVEAANWPLRAPRFRDPSRAYKFDLLLKGMVVRGCLASGEAAAKKGATARTVASEKCILLWRFELGTVELLK